MEPMVKSKHFVLTQANYIYPSAPEDEFRIGCDEEAKDCAVSIGWHSKSDKIEDIKDIEEVYVNYGLPIDAKTRKDEYIRELIDCLEDALVFKKKMLEYIDEIR